MSFAFHHDKPLYFQHQYQNSLNYVLPFINQVKPIKPNMQVLEIGCAEGGVLKAFCEMGCVCTGVELSPSKIESATKFMAQEIENKQITFICKNVYELDFKSEFQSKFDVIILKDTIEHIPNQEKIIDYLKVFLNNEGIIYFGFPAWYMPWGGHQQICKSKFLMFLPYYHLLPMPIYKVFLKMFGESDSKIQELVEIKETGIGISRFEKIVKKSNYKILNRIIFFVNPIYKLKFGWKPRVQFPFISKIPFLRDILSTTVYYTVIPN